MLPKKCCVIPLKVRKNLRLKKALFYLKKDNLRCQFEGILTADYELQNEDFCLLHLPPEFKKDLAIQTAECVQNLIKNGAHNFDFICAQGLNLSYFKPDHHYSFCGAWLWSFQFHHAVVCQLDMSYCKIQGINAINYSSIDHLYIKHSEIGSSIHFLNNRIKLLLAHDSFFNFKDDTIRLDVSNYGFTIEQGKIGTARFINNSYNIALKIKGVEIEALEFIDNTFYVCPIFFKENLKGVSELILPEKKDFNFSKFPPNIKKAKKISDHTWEDQYRKFREIYNIAKIRDMYIEQSVYFSLMQLCLNRISKTPKLLKLFSHIYVLISDYGQSISRPFLWLSGLLILSTMIFVSAGVKTGDAFYLSLTQTIQPYSLLYSNEPRKILSEFCQSETRPENRETLIISFSTNTTQATSMPKENCSGSLLQYKYGWFFIGISIFESTSSLLLLACLILAIRWNFRKA